MIMRFVLTLAAIWATGIAPQLCWVGALTTCCAADAHEQSAPRTADDCAPGGCDRDCRPPGEEPATPAERECRTCENFCGAVVKPADAREHVSQLQTKLLTDLRAAISSNNVAAGAFTQCLLMGPADLPRVPCPLSDFPLLL